MNTTATPPLERPLPKSYMPEAEKEGLSQNDLYVFESQAADHAGDEEASWAWLALAELTEGCKKILKVGCSEAFIKSKGFRV